MLEMQWDFGGSLERVVCSAKSAIRYVLHDHELSDEVLLTALVGVENLLNGRPLTHVADGQYNWGAFHSMGKGHFRLKY